MSNNRAITANGPADVRAAGILRADWPAPARVHALTTLRSGGVSVGRFGAGPSAGLSDGLRAGLNLGAHCGDSPADVLRNRRILAAQLPGEPRWLKQVHGTEVIEFDDARPALDVELIADAAITRTAGQVLCIMTADCLPVFFCNGEGDQVGLCHAGWRGLAAGVLENTLAALLARSPSSARWMAHLGPAIGPAAFEVGDDVRAAFCDSDASAGEHFQALAAPGKFLADIYGLARLRLRRFDLQSVSGGAYCTHRDEGLFYSHRRDRQTGRMASLIWFDRLTVATENA